MRLTHIALDRYRNIRGANLEFHPRFNLIVGDNGQGKTNLLSSIYWLATLTPLRSGRLRNLITWGEQKASVRGWSEVNGLYHELEVKTNGDRTFPLREGHPRSNREYFGALSVVSFTPNDLDLVRGQPEVRRRFLDRAIFNEQSAHLEAVLRYQKALSRRNTFLKERKSEQLIRAYEATLAEVGARLIMSRASYVHSLSGVYSNILHGIGNFSGTISYKLGVPVVDPLSSTPQVIQQQLMSYWNQHRESDIQRGFTQRGPHNDDLVLRLSDRSAKDFASQGQQRAIVLALKIAQIESLSERLQSRPILLLDDVSSELDHTRARQLFKFLSRFDGQVFLTTTHEDFVPVNVDRKMWRIVAGQISPVEDRTLRV